jgi:hypothetical protein
MGTTTYNSTPARRALLAMVMAGKEQEFRDMWLKFTPVNDIREHFNLSDYDMRVYAKSIGLATTQQLQHGNGHGPIVPEPVTLPEIDSAVPDYRFLLLHEKDIQRIADAVVAKLDAAPREKRRGWFR